MKKTIIFLTVVSFLLGNISKVKASHIIGGEVSYTSAGGSNYTVSLILYWDCQGIMPATTLPMIATNTCAFGTVNFNVTQTVSYEVSQLCSSAFTTCALGTNPGVMKSVYVGTATLTGACNNWTFSYTDCCRTTTNNVTGTPSSTFYAILNSVVAPTNNSATFNSLPFPMAIVGQYYAYTPWAQDADGDFLLYNLVDAKSTDATTPVSYAGGYSGAIPVTGMTIDLTQGDIIGTPGSIGNYIVSYEVIEINSTLDTVGITMRDYLLTVIPGTNQPIDGFSGNIANLTGNGIMQSSAADSLYVCGNNPISFQLDFSDADVTDVLTQTNNFATALPGAVVTVVGTNPTSVTVNWAALPALSNTVIDTWITVTDNVCPVPSIRTWHYYFDINVISPHISYTMIPDSANTLNYTTFNGSTIATPVGYSWNFGDASSWDYTYSPSHTYAVGNYSPCLTVSTGNCSVTKCEDITVGGTTTPCMALFNIAMDTSTVNPNDYLVTDLSYGASLSYLWDFGDTTNSSLPLASHTYLGAGPYQLCLTVNDGMGCSHSFCDTLFNADSIHHLPLHPISIAVVHPGYWTTVGTNELTNDNQEIEMYPNPTTGEFSIQNIEFNIKNIQINNVLGQSVYQSSIANHQSTIRVDLSREPKGIYFINITGSNRSSYKQKIIIE